MIKIKNNIIKIYGENINSLNNLSIWIDENLIPKKIEKNKYAEVPTPFALRKDMLDSIPKSFWSNKNYKVFEPCSGKGGFVVDIVKYFMIGLKDKIKDEKKRYKHIVENQLYFADINKINIETCKLLIDPKNKYKLNYYLGDSLEINIEKIWKIKGFDAVIGNPPYNISQEFTTKKGGGDLLWNKFVIEAFDKWLVKDGYLLYVHPSGWRKPESDKSKYKGLFKLMTHDNQMLYLEIHDTVDGMKIFKCGTRYDWYLIQKKKANKKTEIKDEKGKVSTVDLLKWEFLPNYDFNKIQPLLKNKNEKAVDVLFSRNSYESRKKYVSEKKTKEFKYPLVHSTPKKGIRYMYSSTNKLGLFGVPKVIFGESGINDNIVVDKTGKYGMTQEAIGISDNINNLEKIKKALESEKFAEILNACSWSNFRIDWRLFTYLKQDFWKEFL